jgi:hypothetical protein
MEARSHYYCCSAKVVSNTHSECVSVALSVTDANRMRSIILSSVASLVRPFFPRYLIKGKICVRKLLKLECCFIFSTTFETSLILRRIQRDMVKNVRGLHVK